MKFRWYFIQNKAENPLHWQGMHGLNEPVCVSNSYGDYLIFAVCKLRLLFFANLTISTRRISDRTKLDEKTKNRKANEKKTKNMKKEGL